jgi:pimeloyl-ACP methyl ester carboxylesterase
MPERVDQMAALSVSHLTSFANAGFEQLEKSWYMLLFQFQGIAEQWLSKDGWANFRAWARHPDADAVIEELETTGALTPALNWYRANLPPERFVAPAPELPSVQAPTLGVWSSGDAYLTEAQMTGSEKYVSESFRYVRIDDAGHWMQLEEPDEVNSLLLDFLPMTT